MESPPRPTISPPSTPPAAVAAPFSREARDSRATRVLFEQLFAEYQRPIYRYVYRLLGDPEDAWDCTQIAYVKAFQKLGETVAKGDFQPEAWLYRIATNVCRDQLRRRRLIQWQDWDSYVSLFHPSQVASDNPERDVLQQETGREVALVLRQLPARYRTVLILREYHRLSYEAIAQSLGTSRAAVKTLLLRAREAFRYQYAQTHPTLAAAAKGPRVLPRALGRPAAA
jgi:RNA polymerase sigma-70 factor (ECF subfamily)